ncbi:hypothetical protein Poli38472_004401 [Pythium oligandrum]|uniref:EIF3j n=1 Tax=Pythium oligandrum TaxID=41045 RepID=A0A8K1CA12_PYTOL|nr:hypothetical protein Poli38472_004401 [Pythium oligandrum]|eukprot:TMW59332.1 hypothetical protein Poli38472_004401 [Pythium oligandrum]
MDSWDDDEFEVPSLAENQPKVAANWDDSEEEEEEEQTPQVGASGESAPKGPLKPKQLKKLKLKELEEKRAMEVALTKARLAQQANETDEQRKAREKASMEEADLEAALDAFAPAAKKTEATDDVEAALNGMRLISLADHEKFGEAVSKRLLTSNARYALEAMKVIVTRGSVNLTADDMKDLTTIINVIKNEKIAAAKPKGKKKKQTGRQGYANVERDNDGFDDLSGGAGAGRGYDDYDDFM